MDTSWRTPLDGTNRTSQPAATYIDGPRHLRTRTRAPGAPHVVGRQWSDRPPTHWRDPFLIEIDGVLHQLVAASRPDRPSDASGTVGVATSIDAVHWQLRDPIDVEPVSRELECPQIPQIDGCWFLIFSAFPELFSAEMQADPRSNLRHGTYAMIGDGPLGPYRFVQRECITPTNHPDPLYAGQIVTFDGTTFLMGTVWCDDAPDYLSDPIPLRRTGISLQIA